MCPAPTVQSGLYREMFRDCPFNRVCAEGGCACDCICYRKVSHVCALRPRRRRTSLQLRPVLFIVKVIKIFSTYELYITLNNWRKCYVNISGPSSKWCLHIWKNVIICNLFIYNKLVSKYNYKYIRTIE